MCYINILEEFLNAPSHICFIKLSFMEKMKIPRTKKQTNHWVESQHVLGKNNQT